MRVVFLEYFSHEWRRKKTLVFFLYTSIKVIEFCPFLVVFRVSGPVRFCVIKTFSAAQFVNAMGIVGAERLSNLSRQLTSDEWPARGSCCRWARS